MKISKTQFETFKKHVYFWQRELGLDDWKIYVFHKKPSEGSYATTYTSCINRVATIHLAPSWQDREPNDYELKECALHEVMHIVTAPLFDEAHTRHTMSDDIDAAEHSVVVRLTNYIMRTGEEK